MSTKRKLSNWIKSYLDYVDNTESALIFKTWVSISVMASALRRKISFSLGMIDIYPNFYIVLVGPPGSRKTQAIKFGHKILEHFDQIKISADAITREALLIDLEESQVDAMLPGGKSIKHASMTVFSAELETFVGSKADNTKMIMTLTDLWDCPDKWRYRTKGQGSNLLPHVFINLLGATTPDSIASSIPPTAIGSGFTSRIIFCFCDSKHKKVDIPEDTPELKHLRNQLIHDLAIIANMAGTYKFDDESKTWWKWWYNQYDDQDIHRICKDPTFNGWYERKPMFVLKLGMVLAAAENDELIVHNRHFEGGLELLKEVEKTMGNSFRMVGRSEITAEMNILFTLIKQHRVITETELTSITWRDLGGKFNAAMDTVVRTGKVRRDYPPGGGITYTWIGEK